MENERYFICHAGTDDPTDITGMMGRVYAWRGEWIRSPRDVATNDRNPVMKLYALWNERLEIVGDVGCFTEVFFKDSPRDPYPSAWNAPEEIPLHEAQGDR